MRMTTFTADSRVPEIHIHFPAARHDNFERALYFSILGDVVQPLVLANPDCSFWVTWYEDEDLSTYGDRYALPPNEYTWGDDDNPKTSFICLRISDDQGDEIPELMKQVTELATEKGYYASEWATWDVVGDLGSNRFIRPDATPEERAERADLIVQFMDITTRLLMDALICVHGVWMIEPNNSRLARNGNFLTAVHHLFCNATDVPTIARSPDRIKGIQVEF